jgi:GNAT superfamily N-acetyltransferase
MPTESVLAIRVISRRRQGIRQIDTVAYSCMRVIEALKVRPVVPADLEAWRPLWDGYNAFYARSGPTALSEEITAVTWSRFFNPIEPVFALVAEHDGQLLGLAHYLFHRSTTRVEPVCYLQDLFTAPPARGQGVGRALVEAVYRQAAQAGATRVYWQTQVTNSAGRLLYDKVAKHLGFIVYSHEVTGAA